MALQDIIFRTLTKLGFTTKNSELTWIEGDENLSEIIDALLVLQAQGVGNISPYNGATTYSPLGIAQYVSYNQNIYLFIGGGPSTGVTPGTAPAATVWQLTTSGALTHAQNTDQWLAAGTPVAVSATQLKGIYNSLVIPISYANALASMTGNTLRPGYWYFIFDKGIYIQALKTNEFTKDGYGEFKNVDYQNLSGKFIGCWRAGMPGVALNKYTAWNGLMYNNITGVNGTTNPLTDTVNWALLPTTHADYVTEVDKIIYYIFEDKVSYREDKRGNKIGGEIIDHNIYVNLFQWGNNVVYGNSAINGYIYCVNARSTISKNVLCGEFLEANIEDGNVINNNTFTNSRVYASNIGVLYNSEIKSHLNVRFLDNELLTDLFITNNISNKEIILDITGLTILEFALFGPQIYNAISSCGVIKLSSTNQTELLNEINSGIYILPNMGVKFMPVQSLNLELSTGPSFILLTSSNILLQGSKNDFIVLNKLGSPTTLREDYSSIMS